MGARARVLELDCCHTRAHFDSKYTPAVLAKLVGANKCRHSQVTRQSGSSDAEMYYITMMSILLRRGIPAFFRAADVPPKADIEGQYQVMIGRTQGEGVLPPDA